MTNKKIAILIWDMGLGGVQRQVADISTEISKKHPQYQVEIWIKNKKKNYYTGLSMLQSVTLVEMGGASGRLHTLIDFLKIIKQIIISRPSTLLTFHEYLSIFSLIIIKLLRISYGTKVVVYEPNYTSLYMKFKKRSYLWNILIRKIYPYADHILTTTKAAADDLREKYGLNRSRLIAIPTWSREISTQRAVTKKYDLLFLGRLEPQKRPELFVELISRLHQQYSIDATGIICGGGSKRIQVQQKIKKLKLQKSITMAGIISPSKTKEIISQSSILILPSLFEGMPLVIIEAAASGVPTVVSNYPGADELVIDGKSGYIVYSLETMTDRVRALLSNQKQYEAMSQFARKHSKENFGHKRIEEFVQLLR